MARRVLARPTGWIVLFVVLLGAAWWAGSEQGQAGPLTANGTQPGLSKPLKLPGDCDGCHGDYDAAGNYEPFPSWAGSLMAQSGRDPLFWASLDVAENDIPGVGDFCLRCHSPHGWLEGRSEPPGGSTDGCGLDGLIDDVDNDFSGLTCHFCHRMQINPSPPPGQLAVYEENGQFWIDDVGCGGGGGNPCRHGPYDYPADGSHTPNHQWVFDPYFEDSQMCGNCHNVTSPAHNLIIAGVDTGVPMPVERTYKEWQQSDFSVPASPDFKACQHCHMPDSTANPAWAASQQQNDHTGDLPVHRFAGGNAWIPDVIRQEYPNLNRTAQLTATRNWALDMLQNQSALVEVTTPASVNGGSTLNLLVRVTNLTGHKLPTGYPEGRRMWLNVQVRDGASALIWESGAYDAATGDLLTDAQIKVYETKPGIWNHLGTNQCDVDDAGGNPMFHFVRNNCVYKDNRIPPQGFTGGGDIETQPVGYSYPETSPGSGILVHWDDTPYAVPIPAGTVGPVSVIATLRYQTTSKEYVEFLDDQATQNSFPADCIERTTGFITQSRGAYLYSVWQTYGRSAPVDMNADTGSVVVIGGGCGNGTVEAGELCDDGNTTDGDGCDSNCTPTGCGNGIVTAGEACDDGGESATCDADCTPAVCGDGTLNATAGEACDDGGESATCDADCTPAVCGDSTVNVTAGETCDDGGESATCDADCTSAVCGDFTVNATAGETCDDGGESAACDANCTVAVCGDGTLNTTAGESCDDGGESATCDADCTPATCGDSTVNATAGETCDDGGESATCDTDCTAAACGDGHVNATAGETCDDGNTVSGDGCDANCTIAGCGNGVVAGNEVCDDGNTVNGDGCDANCTPTGCGNGIVTAGEACDDGGETATCDADCTPASCGDGTLNATAGEICDDGGETATCDVDCTPAACGDSTVNASAGETCDDGGESATCDTDCTPAVCGDGTLNATAGEACDDGNTVSGDGCDANCTIAGCGNGVVAGNEVCDDGNLVNGDGCDANCTPTGCGNGIVTAGEDCDDNGESATCDADCSVAECGDGTLNATAGEGCDDGNTTAGDGCDATCQPESAPDAGVPDAGPADAGPADAGPADAGAADAAVADAATDDGGVSPDGTVVTPDAGDPPSAKDSGCNCNASVPSDAGLPVLALLFLGLWWVRRRR